MKGRFAQHERRTNTKLLNPSYDKEERRYAFSKPSAGKDKLRQSTNLI